MHNPLMGRPSLQQTPTRLDGHTVTVQRLPMGSDKPSVTNLSFVTLATRLGRSAQPVVAQLLHQDRVAPGRYRPGAPTDPYVCALAHIMWSTT